MQKATSPRQLDDKAFEELEAAGSRKRGKQRITFSEPLRARLRLAIRRNSDCAAFAQTRSPDAINRMAAVAAIDPLVLRNLDQLELHHILYGEDTALAMCVDRVSSGDPKSDELLPLVPVAIRVLEQLVGKAKQRLRELDKRFTRKHPRRATHNDLPAREVAEIFQLAGGKLGFNKETDGPFTRFLKKLWEFLPSGARTMTCSGFVAHCKRALDDQDRRKIERRVLHALRGGDKTTKDLRGLFDKDFKKDVLDRGLAALKKQGHVTSTRVRAGRQRVETWRLQKPPEVVEREIARSDALDGSIAAAMLCAVTRS